jgi:hypothetical protein
MKANLSTKEKEKVQLYVKHRALDTSCTGPTFTNRCNIK